ncbi:MAG: SdpI family protein [Erysipelotrichaceae bacterium]|nr:SdpI family protein [Erysipelotrichaceae bacterium]
MKKYWFIITLCILMLGAGALTYPSLPSKIPIHFDIHGQIDGYCDKIYIFAIPLMTAILSAVMAFLPHLDPHKANYAKFQKSYDAFINVFALFISMMFAITMYSAYYPNSLDVPMIITLAVGLLVSWIGNVMPKFRWNYFIGIRCPWTLASEQVWFLTHRFAGKVWMIGGLLIIAGAFLPPMISFLYLITVVLMMSFIPMIYAYLKYQKIDKGEKI